MSEYPVFLGSRAKCVDPEEAEFHVIPVPFERNPDSGTAEGVSAMLSASECLEPFTGQAVPNDHGIYTQAPIPCKGAVEDVLAAVEADTRKVLERGAVPVLLGGEHTLSVGAFRAIKSTFDDVGIIQFDAHADLKANMGGTVYDRSCVMSHALDLDVPFLQIGVRSLSKEEAKVRNRKEVWYFDAMSLAVKGLDRVFIPDDFPQNVYVTFDLDVFDASIMPATPTPEPGGLSWYEALALLAFVSDNCNVVGFDMVELSPIPGIDAPNYVAARLAHEFMALLVND